MERKFPKNVRQIGNVSANPRIYVEDYVDTFLNQICDKEEENPVGAFLVGEQTEIEGEECVYISGAIRMTEVEKIGPDIALSDLMWQEAEEEHKKYFQDQQIIGWFMILPDKPLAINSNLINLHQKTFPKENTIFIMKDSKDKEELYFVYKYHDLIQMGGHYIYYERNPTMQNYMISTRKRNGVTPSEVVEDRAAKDFRTIVREKSDSHAAKSGNRFLYASSTALVLIILIIGVTMINNYDKIQAVQSSLDQVLATVEGKDPGTKDADSKDQTHKDAVTTFGQEITSENGQAEDVTASDEKTRPETTEPDKQTSSEKETGQTNSKTSDDASDTTDKQGDSQASNAVVSDTSNHFYIVEEGDTLATISKKVYGTVKNVDAIRKMNGLSDGNLILIGQKLLLP